jgi:hypothetical protein
VGYTNNVHSCHVTHWDLNHRISVDIRRYIVKRGKRNVISRPFHTKNDKQAIAVWRAELDVILHIFDVRPLSLAGLLLTFRFQTELATSTGVNVPDTQQDTSITHDGVPGLQEVSSASATISEVPHNTLDTHPILSTPKNDITGTHTSDQMVYRIVPKIYESLGVRSQEVRACALLKSHNFLSLVRAMPGQQSRQEMIDV